jgi:hypothetical protein
MRRGRLDLRRNRCSERCEVVILAKVGLCPRINGEASCVWHGGERGRSGVGEERSNQREGRIVGGKVHSNHGHLLIGQNAGSRIGADVDLAKLASRLA